MVLIMNLHLSLRPMQNILLGLVQVPLSHLVFTDEPVNRVHINLRKEQNQPIGNIELVLVIQIVFSIHEIFPLGLRLLAGGRVVRVEFGVRMLKVLLFPLLLFTAAFDLSNNWVESDVLMVLLGGMMRSGEGEVGTKLKAAMAMARMLLWGVGEKQQDEYCCSNIHNYRGLPHRIDDRCLL